MLWQYDATTPERRLFLLLVCAYALQSVLIGLIARKLGLPARRISNAINRVHGMSVSQYVNNYRVEEACRLLAATDEPITQIAFEAGFLTKSNFNREFLRVTGKSPTAWRQKHEGVLDRAA